MNSHNAEKLARNESIRLESGRPRAPHDGVKADVELTIDESFDLGSDPYNSTGRHVIMKSKINRED